MKKYYLYFIFFITSIFLFFTLTNLPTIRAAFLPDIDVTNIEMTPRYNRYRTQYLNDVPSLIALPQDPDGNPNNDKHWPDPGEKITFTAHFVNKGQDLTKNFRARWIIDGQEKITYVYPGMESKQAITSIVSFTWPDNLDDHTIQFVLDPDNQITESAKNNNQLTEYTNSLSFSIYIEEELYNLFEQTKNGVNTYSFEDWIQWQFAGLRNLFAQAKYPLTPEGIQERIRIDRIIVIPYDPNNLNNWRNVMNDDPFIFQTDGRWQFTSDKTTLEEKKKDWQNYVNEYIQKIDYGLLHELTHQLGMIDNYRFNIANDKENHYRIYVKDKRGQFVFFDQTRQCQGLMGHDSAMQADGCKPNQIEDHTAIALQNHLHLRRGFYGEYLFDIPDNNRLQILDSNNKPLANTKISIYQKSAADESFDDVPEHQGTTDQDGYFYLTNRPVITAEVLSHKLKLNPFGQINVVGTNGTFLIKIEEGDQEEFQWLTIRPFNLAYWSGQKDLGTYVIKTKLTPVLKITDTNKDTTDKSNTPSWLLEVYRLTNSVREKLARLSTQLPVQTTPKPDAFLQVTPPAINISVDEKEARSLFNQVIDKLKGLLQVKI